MAEEVVCIAGAPQALPYKATLNTFRSYFTNGIVDLADLFEPSALAYPPDCNSLHTADA